ncbi:hypothetical protein LINPERPRIM_LOCUS6329 [Linum perenne]
MILLLVPMLFRFLITLFCTGYDTTLLVCQCLD